MLRNKYYPFIGGILEQFDVKCLGSLSEFGLKCVIESIREEFNTGFTFNEATARDAEDAEHFIELVKVCWEAERFIMFQKQEEQQVLVEKFLNMNNEELRNYLE